MWPSTPFFCLFGSTTLQHILWGGGDLGLVYSMRLRGTFGGWHQLRGNDSSLLWPGLPLPEQLAGARLCWPLEAGRTDPAIVSVEGAECKTVLLVVNIRLADLHEEEAIREVWQVKEPAQEQLEEEAVGGGEGLPWRGSPTRRTDRASLKPARKSNMIVTLWKTRYRRGHTGWVRPSVRYKTYN